MNRRELVKTLADKMSVTQAEAMRFVQAWEETTTEALESDGSLMLLGFGTLSAWEQTERIGLYLFLKTDPIFRFRAHREEISLEVILLADIVT